MTSRRITLSTTQVAQRLGIKGNAVRQLADGGYLTDVNKTADGKRHHGAFAQRDVRFLVRYYKVKGQAWKKDYAAAKAALTNGTPLPAPTAKAIKEVKPTVKPVASIVTRIGNIETRLTRIEAKLDQLIAIWQ